MMWRVWMRRWTATCNSSHSFDCSRSPANVQDRIDSHHRPRAEHPCAWLAASCAELEETVRRTDEWCNANEHNSRAHVSQPRKLFEEFWAEPMAAVAKPRTGCLTSTYPGA
jgi:hypothetical protein